VKVPKQNLKRCLKPSLSHLSLHIELPAKLLDYFLRSNKSNINKSSFKFLASATPPVSCCWPISVLHNNRSREIHLWVVITLWLSRDRLTLHDKISNCGCKIRPGGKGVQSLHRPEGPVCFPCYTRKHEHAHTHIYWLMLLWLLRKN